MRSPAMANVQTLVALAGLGEIGQEVMRIMGAQDPSNPQQPMGDEQALTTVDELGNPTEPIVSDARMNAQVDQAARQFQ